MTHDPLVFDMETTPEQTQERLKALGVIKRDPWYWRLIAWVATLGSENGMDFRD